jgi:hypothetical protein
MSGWYLNPLENTKLNPISKDIAAKRIHDDLCRKERRNLSNTIINTPTTVEKTKSIFIK